ncbi:aspartate kinase [Krasilnikovia cinnamomea]|uniref:Aspartokinase n=1 Tax=Krasilnikovia cinnamomea TaxID=349313 RepID=A0A4Q7ZPD2_9ACTN|nr:aspartate kinase [Krasilnikovia cinnamomea]RZU52383.1 aspartate kinase [Krasilnikovia cinnamomea]
MSTALVSAVMAPAPLAAAPSVPRRVVWKFGGSSVADPEKLRAVARRLVAAHRQGVQVVAVLSAMGDTTDDLVRLAYEMAARPQSRELDALLSVGESMSCALTAMAVHELGERAISFNGLQAGFRTDDAHGNASLWQMDPRRVVQALDDGLIVLVTGYQGMSAGGDVTTLGRGGSDASAIALAAALGLRQCDIFTDVTGVFTADPRVVPGARQLDSLGHEEMLQLAEAGAQVLQTRAVELAAAHQVDIHVRSTFTTTEGTWIRRVATVFEQARITGVAHRRRDPVYTVRGLSPATVSGALARRGSAVGSIIPDTDRLRFTAPGSEVPDVVAALADAGVSVDVRDDLGSVSVVCPAVGNRPEISARMLAALERGGIEPQLVTSTPGRVSAHVGMDLVDRAATLLHDEFGLDAAPAAPVEPAAPAELAAAGERG